MARFVKGDVVVVPFPYSDLSNVRRRPAFVIANLQGDDLILCQITSRSIRDEYAIELRERDFEEGSLRQISNIRPNCIFTADSHIVLYKAGKIKMTKLKDVVDTVVRILRS